ncbi:MAG: hypothetical protein JO129_01105 [Candidatus Dependentiae bacterium]|nr:hypothetical protein [Candidatus Dependentiae bacterium]
MTQPQIKNIFFVVISSLLFFLEIMLFALLQRYEIYPLFCFFIALLVQSPQKRTLVMPLFLMSLLSYLEINIFGWCLVYIIPTILLANYLDQHLRIKIIIPYCLLIFALCLKMILMWNMDGITISWIHAAQIIIYNIIILKMFIIVGAYLEKRFEGIVLQK